MFRMCELCVCERIAVGFERYYICMCVYVCIIWRGYMCFCADGWVVGWGGFFLKFFNFLIFFLGFVRFV